MEMFDGSKVQINNHNASVCNIYGLKGYPTFLTCFSHLKHSSKLQQAMIQRASHPQPVNNYPSTPASNSLKTEITRGLSSCGLLMTQHQSAPLKQQADVLAITWPQLSWAPAPGLFTMLWWKCLLWWRFFFLNTPCFHEWNTLWYNVFDHLYCWD